MQVLSHAFAAVLPFFRVKTFLKLVCSSAGATIAAVAGAFLGQRRVIWLHGKVEPGLIVRRLVLVKCWPSLTHVGAYVDAWSMQWDAWALLQNVAVMCLEHVKHVLLRWLCTSGCSRPESANQRCQRSSAASMRCRATGAVRLVEFCRDGRLLGAKMCEPVNSPQLNDLRCAHSRAIRPTHASNCLSHMALS